MKFTINYNQLVSNLPNSLRKAGYFPITSRATSETSFVRNLASNQHYPRFHLYVVQSGKDYIFNLHLDQKQASYQGAHAHNADYDEPAVMAEAERLQSIIQQ